MLVVPVLGWINPSWLVARTAGTELGAIVVPVPLKKAMQPTPSVPFDTVTEFKKSLKVGIGANDIVFSGVGKSDQEIEFAIKEGCFQINAESISEIKRELIEYINDNPVSDEELDKVKDNNTLSLPGRWETINAISNDISEIITYGLPDDYWDQYSNNVRNLTRKRLINAASAVIKPENLIWVIVGDREEIEEKISNLPIKEIIILDRNGQEIIRP